MAFTFVPPFNEGDKQTNPETGVEYIYSGGAWRALGPKIEDEFDTLDDRYVKLEGTTIVGDYYRLRGPGTGGGTSTFQVIDEGTLKLYNLATPQDSNTAWAAPVGYVQEYVQEQIAAIPDVDLDGYATEEYVDDAIAAIPDVDLSGYLPLTGGDLTGVLNIDRPSNPALIISQNGTENLKLWADGAVTTTKTDFGPSALVTKTYVDGAIGNIDIPDVDLSGYLPLSGGTLTGTLVSNATTNQRLNFLTNGSSANCDISRNGTWQVSIQDGKTKVATQIDMTNHKIINVTDPSGAKDAANKGYVDGKMTGGRFYVSAGSLYFEVS